MSKRRDRGEGTIAKRADGRWTAAITLDDGRRKWFYGSTRREVADKLAKALNDRKQGTLLLTSERLTLGQYLATWLTSAAKPSVRPKTFVSYSGLVRNHIAPSAIAKRQLTKLNGLDIQAFLNEKLESGYSARTVQYLHAVLRRALGQAVKWNLVPRNVASLAAPPKVSRTKVQPLTPEQVRCFLDVAKQDRLAAVFTVAVALGLRQGEVLGLRWQDVDLDRRTLTISFALQRLGGGKGLALVEPKTAESRRTIMLPDYAVAALREHRTRQLQERLLAGDKWKDQGFVFTTRVGTPLDPRRVQSKFKKLLDQAGLPDMRFHDLRHTCASLLLAQGVPARMIMEILGHSKISTTMDLYSHILPTLQTEAAAKMDAVLSGN